MAAHHRRRSIHTYDIFEEAVSKQKVGTKEFAQAVVARMGKKPEKLAAVSYAGAQSKRKDWVATPRNVDVQMIGVDLYVGSKGITPQALGDSVKEITHEGLTLKMIDNRGVIVYPGGMSETFLTDSYRCRFEAGGAVVTSMLRSRDFMKRWPPRATTSSRQNL